MEMEDSGTVTSPAQLDSSLDSHSVVIVPVSADSTGSDRTDYLRQADQTISQYMDKLASTTHNVIVLLTGATSSWKEGEEELSRYRRHLLLSETVDRNASDFAFYYLDCGLLYLNKSICYSTNSSDCSLLMVTDAKMNCESNSSSTLTITLDKGEINMILSTEADKGSWKLGNISAQVLDKPEHDMKLAEPMDVPSNFSFSCSTFHLSTLNKSEDSFTLTIDRFQVQPYVLSSNITQAFFPSFDCQPFFTIPVFMGLIVGIFLTTILAVGIYMLFNIKTPDRFDDPKGRLVSMAPAE